MPGGLKAGSRCQNHFGGYNAHDRRLRAGARKRADLHLYFDVAQSLDSEYNHFWRASNECILGDNDLDPRLLCEAYADDGRTVVYRRTDQWAEGPAAGTLAEFRADTVYCTNCKQGCRRGSEMCYHCYKRTLDLRFEDPADLPPADYAAMATAQNEESEALAIVVYQTTGVEVTPLVLQTRFQVLWGRGYGMRSRNAEFKRRVTAEEEKAKNLGYPGGYQERYRLCRDFRNRCLVRGYNYHSIAEAMELPRGPAYDPGWGRGRGPSSACYGRADPESQAAYKIYQRRTWQELAAKGKSKGKRSQAAFPAGVNANWQPGQWWTHVDLEPNSGALEWTEERQPPRNNYSSASKRLGDEDDQTDVESYSRRVSARTYCSSSASSSSGRNATARWEPAVAADATAYEIDYADHFAAERPPTDGQMHFVPGMLYSVPLAIEDRLDESDDDNDLVDWRQEDDGSYIV